MNFEIYKDLSGQWRWRLRASNGKIIADSAEGYWNRADCLAGVALVKSCSLASVSDEPVTGAGLLSSILSGGR